MNASEWFGKDKVAHLTYSAFITYWSYGMSKDILKKDNRNSTYLSITIPLSLGFMKEYSDKNFKKTGWSWKDLSFDILGIVAGSIIIKRGGLWNL
jgi:uncharacterized protein YfiM (DUF2279 family)